MSSRSSRGKAWANSKRRAAKRRKQYEVQNGVCAKCLMPWPLEALKVRFISPDPEEHAFDLRCEPCIESPPQRVSFRAPHHYGYTKRRQSN